MLKVANVWLFNFCALRTFAICRAVKRLKQWSEFQAVMSASTVSRTAHFVLHRWQVPAKTGPRLEFEKPPTLFAEGVLMMGALTPKRWAKRAVTRNLIRRQIHVLSQEFKTCLPPTAYVVRLRARFSEQRFVSASSEVLKRAVREELRQLFSTLSYK